MHRPFLFAALAMAWVLAPATVRAQAPEAIPTGEPSAYRFYVAPGAGNFLMVDATAIGRPWEPSVGLVVDYAHRPFAIDDYEYLTYTAPEPGGPELDLVAGMLTAQIDVAVAMADFVQLGLNFPIVAYTWGAGHRWTERTPEGGTAPRQIAGGSGAGLGDPRLHGKVRLFEQDLGEGAFLSAALAAWITFPLARATLPGRYAGEPGLAGGAHVILGFRWNALRFALNLGVGAREHAQVLASARTTEMTWGGGLAYDFTEIFGALVEVVGQTTFGLVFDDEAPTELRGALYLRAGEVRFTIGLGVGIAYAIGVPEVRGLLGGAWEPRPRADGDADGLSDEQDACPAEPEDRDGFADEDGCPDLDDDADGVGDASDRCPGEAEDRDEHDDGDGCPEPDDDGDGISDGYDSCPAEPEDVDGDRDQDGCPDHDRDLDHFADDVDHCPDAPEDTDGFGDEDGCPEDDFDQDGVPDVDDSCVEQTEDPDGFEDHDGCPEPGGGAGRAARRR